MVALFIGLAIAAVVAIGVISWYLKKKRREELATVAGRLGMQFSAEDPFGLLRLPFALLEKGDGRGTENVLWGSWESLEVKEFDYWYYVESTDSKGNRTRSYHRFSCAVTDLRLTAPHLTVTREGMFTRLADHMGFPDIQFESEDFNRAFQVKSPDREFATAVIDQRMMAWLIQSSGRCGFELEGSSILCFSRKLKPPDLTPLLGTLKGFCDHVPRAAYSLYGSGSGSRDVGGTFTA